MHSPSPYFLLALRAFLGELSNEKCHRASVQHCDQSCQHFATLCLLLSSQGDSMIGIACQKFLSCHHHHLSYLLSAMLIFLYNTDLHISNYRADLRPELDWSHQYGWLWHYPPATLTSSQHKHKRPHQGSPRLLIIKKLWLGLCLGPVCTNMARRRGGKVKRLSAGWGFNKRQGATALFGLQIIAGWQSIILQPEIAVERMIEGGEWKKGESKRVWAKKTE